MNQYCHNLLAIILIASSLAGCSARYHVNDSIDSINKEEGYRIGAKHVESRSDNLVVNLAFSGGGTRAAAFSYGVLEALRDTKITRGGVERRFIDEIDSISSVSGGSFTAAYYGLFGERIFEDYEEKFLKQNVQGKLTRSFLNPFTWFTTGSPLFGRTDYAAEYYDEILFEGKTFGDILKRKDAPLIQINATEVSTSTQFTFVQSIFDLICSDLATYPVSRAVAASSAVPVLFSSITLNNNAGSCGYELSKLAEEGLNTKKLISRRRHLLEKYSKYLDSETYPYLHLYDGGLTDNLGIRPGLNRLSVIGDAWELIKKRNLEDINELVYIVVNAQSESKNIYSKSASAVPFLDSILGATSIPLNEYTFESLATMYFTMNKFEKDLIAGRCADKEYIKDNTNDCADFKARLIYVDIDQLQDVEQRNRLKLLPTSFVLKPEEVDELREAAKTILLQSEDFNNLLLKK
jgi:NTE family protein